MEAAHENRGTTPGNMGESYKNTGTVHKNMGMGRPKEGGFTNPSGFVSDITAAKRG
jgi:hypothetical protein